jgi:hypothetical protein
MKTACFSVWGTQDAGMEKKFFAQILSMEVKHKLYIQGITPGALWFS